MKIKILVEIKVEGRHCGRDCKGLRRSYHDSCGVFDVLLSSPCGDPIRCSDCLTAEKEINATRPA